MLAVLWFEFSLLGRHSITLATLPVHKSHLRKTKNHQSTGIAYAFNPSDIRDIDSEDLNSRLVPTIVLKTPFLK
jgi:hypothetical protein